MNSLSRLTPMVKALTLFAILLLPLFFNSCGSSTTLVNSWKDPELATNPEKFTKVLAMVLTRNETARRSAEDKIVAKGKHVTQSYTIFGDLETVKDEAKAKQIIEEIGFDGILTLRLVSKETTQTYVQGSTAPSYGYWGYHGAYYGAYNSPGYYQTNQNYMIECNVFSLKRDKLIWSGITSTVNPADIDQVVDEVLYALYNKMVKDGLIQKTTTN